MKLFNFEDRLVAFAGDCVFFIKTLPKDDIGNYYRDQILRSSGSATLHYGEAQGTNTSKDFIHKLANVFKALKENRTANKIVGYIEYGDSKKRVELLEATKELITNTMLLNKKQNIQK